MVIVFQTAFVFKSCNGNIMEILKCLGKLRGSVKLYTIRVYKF
ncbi:hypothetical protein l11_03460 [Neisseria weaveri LMG 5135]|nr:hypothetical protein l11_03460 [Neisseria weaveri LMG 5135]